jgi:hypothetical protein
VKVVGADADEAAGAVAAASTPETPLTQLRNDVTINVFFENSKQ